MAARYLGKCKGVGSEITVVGVRTRAQAALAMAATDASSGSSLTRSKKIRKVPTTTTTAPYNNVHELRSTRRRRVVISPAENSASSECCLPENMSPASEVVLVANCTSRSEISFSKIPDSCCSSNNASSSSIEVIKNRQDIIPDPEVESAETSSSTYFDCNTAARRVSNLGEAKSDDLDSPATRIPDAKSTVQIKMPSDTEIEEFFAAAEEDLQKRFIEKYNFDIVKDVPLGGRYEWVSIKP